MQIENELKKSLLLLHRIYDQATLNGRVTPELYKDISDSLESIDLALGKQEPLAKNKQCDDDFYCEWQELGGKGFEKCGNQCLLCRDE